MQRRKPARDVRARRITEEMKLATAKAMAGCISQSELSPECIIPSVFNREVVQRMAETGRRAAINKGVTKKSG